MKKKALYAIHVLLVVIVAWGLGFSSAKGQAGMPPNTPAELTGSVDGSFNYQGVLKENGVPVTGTRSMSFKLYTSSDCSSGLLQTFTPAGSISVANGLFSVPISFSQTYISGQALYLEVDVTGSKLSCEALRPVPYALSLKPQARVDGAVPHDAVVYLHNSDTSTNFSDGLYAIANGPTGSGVTGIGTNASGFGVRAINSSGVALHAEGKIWNDQDSVVELSPYSLVIRDAYPGVVVTPKGAEGYYGAVEVHFHGLPSDIYAMVPISAFSTLYGSPMYVKSLYVCYSVAGADTYISATQAIKRKESNNSYELYLNESPTTRNSTTVSCYTVNAATPYNSLDSSSFVQFNMHFGNVAFGSYINIHEVRLTLTEESGE